MWKRKVTILLFLLLANSPNYSQTSPKLGDWTFVSPVDDSFAIETLVDLKELFTELEDERRVFGGDFDGRWFRVFSVKANEESEWRIVSNFVASNGNRITLPPVQGGRSSVSFVDGDDFRHFISAISTKSRVYIAHAITPDNENDRLIGDRFTRSLKISDQTLGGISKSDRTDVSATSSNRNNGTSEPISRSSKADSNSSTAAGSKNGIGIGPSGVKSTPKTNRTVSGLKILSKPRPPYTDLARFYEIQGSVTLRIKFLADGKIGDVQGITKLPFGLTATAEHAAKRIAFEPAYMDGTPRTVTKTFQYTFTIY